jgi:hypothetical protein
MAYLKIQRLHGVRRALKVSDPETRRPNSSEAVTSRHASLESFVQ